MSLLGAVVTPGANAQFDDQELEQMIYALLSRVAADPKTSPPFTVKGKEIRIGKHRVQVRPVSEGSHASADRHAVGVRFEISIDGKPNAILTSGTVGVAETKQSAQKVAVSEWYLQFGNTLFAALARQAPSFGLGRFAVYAGPLGLRLVAPSQTQPAGFPGAREVLTAVVPQLPRPDGSLHSVSATIALETDGRSSGELRIDGDVSSEALTLALRLPWPARHAPFMYKQAYYLV